MAFVNTPLILRLCGRAQPEYINHLKVRAHGSSHQIVYMGPQGQQELIEHYQHCDIFVFPSHSEGLGKALLEAMSCGCPVVCSDIPIKQKDMHTDNNRPIAFFIPALNGGGAQKVVVNLVNALPELTDHPLHVVLARREGEFLDELRPEVQVIDLGTNSASRSVWALARYMRTYKPQVLMSSMNYANIVCMLSGLLARRPCRIVLREATVVLPHSGSSPVRFRKNRLIYLMTLFYPFADGIIANSQNTLNSMEQAGIRVRNKAAVIGNPITIPPPTPEPISWDWLPEPCPPFICSAGRLAEPKGFDILLSAFARLKDTRLHLVILGEGELRVSLTRQAEDLGIEDRVHMPGFVQNPMAVVRQSEVFVLSSRWEGFGNVLVEALATGVPVVSTDCPGAPRDILENGAHGHLVSHDDPDALAAGISRALENPAGTPERRKARAEDFSAEKIARKYLEEALLPDKQS